MGKAVEPEDMDEDEFWDYLSRSDDEDPSPLVITEPKKSNKISSGLVKTKDGAMAHPLHSVFPRDSKAGCLQSRQEML